MPPTEVLSAAKRFFTGTEAVHAAWVEAESPTHISFATFRSNVVVSAVPETGAGAGTRVRVSSLRDAGAVGRFLTYLETTSGGTTSEAAFSGEAGSGASPAGSGDRGTAAP